MQTTELQITGMTCRHCVMAVTRALEDVPGVTGVEVSLEPGHAIVSGPAAPELLIRAVEQEGYHALSQR